MAIFYDIIKHSRKIKDKVNGEDKPSMGEKAGEILTELLIIVFAVSLSTWLHDWSVARHQQTEVKEFLVDLKDDLKKDVAGLNNQKIALNRVLASYALLYQLTPKRSDSLLKANFTLNQEFRAFFGEENDGNFEGFKSSGKIGYIENKKLKKQLLSYYQQFIPASRKTGQALDAKLLRVEEFIVKNRLTESQNRTAWTNPGFQTDLEFAIRYAKISLKVGDAGLQKARDVISEIDK